MVFHPALILMWPIFGPSNPRDTVGLVVDILTDPLNVWSSNTGRLGVSLARAGVEAVDQRAQNYEFLNDLEKSSLDFYAAIRSLYRQHRAHEIFNEKEKAQSLKQGMAGFSDIPELDGEELSRR